MTNSKGGLTARQVMHKVFVRTYFVSGWIENLGVVPLFLSAAFLFWPCFLTLFFLIILVCFVLDDISPPLLQQFLISRKNFLTFYTYCVNASLLLIMTTTISLAETNQSKNQIVISIGQQIELPIKSMSSYSIGNKDLLSARYLESRKLLLIKGKKQGFSDLIVWHNARQKSQYRIFVLSKKDQLKTIQIHKLLKENNLIPRQISGQIHVDGKIKSREAYRIIIALQSLLKEKFINHTTLNRTVAKKIITESYLFLNN